MYQSGHDCLQKWQQGEFFTISSLQVTIVSIFYWVSELSQEKSKKMVMQKFGR